VYRHIDDINAICELMDVERGDLELDMFSRSDLDAFVEFLCTSKFVCVCTLKHCTISIIKYTQINILLFFTFI